MGSLMSQVLAQIRLQSALQPHISKLHYILDNEMECIRLQVARIQNLTTQTHGWNEDEVVQRTSTKILYKNQWHIPHQYHPANTKQTITKLMSAHHSELVYKNAIDTHCWVSRNQMLMLHHITERGNISKPHLVSEQYISERETHARHHHYHIPSSQMDLYS